MNQLEDAIDNDPNWEPQFSGLTDEQLNMLPGSPQIYQEDILEADMKKAEKDLGYLDPALKEKQIAVLYHANCLDGLGAAYAAWKKFGDTAEYIPVTYGEQAPALSNKAIYILDFSYKAGELDYLARTNKSVVVIDHHKTALSELIEAERLSKLTDSDFTFSYTVERSGAVLSWAYFHPAIQVPRLLLYIEDRDLWKFKMQDTKALIAGLLVKGMDYLTFQELDTIIERWEIDSKQIIEVGTFLNMNYDMRCKQLATKAYKCGIEYAVQHPELGLQKCYVQGLAINATQEYASELGHILATKSGSFGAVWTYIGKGLYKISLRSNGDFDVYEIAKHYGGGGHKNAAGFTVNKKDGQKLRLILVEEEA